MDFGVFAMVPTSVLRFFGFKRNLGFWFEFFLWGWFRLGFKKNKLRFETNFKFGFLM
jgi:hypothetical protein